MSHFMSSMPEAVLSDRPPLSKVTPLPTKATGRLSLALGAPFQRMTTRRGGCSLPWATPSSAPMPSLRIRASSSTSTLTPRAVSPRACCASDLGKMTLAGSETRLRVRKTPAATFSSGP